MSDAPQRREAIDSLDHIRVDEFERIRVEAVGAPGDTDADGDPASSRTRDS